MAATVSRDVRSAADMTGTDGRSEARANVFLGAALHAAGELFPVRIRNLSPRGALIDGPALPPPKSAVRLQRGNLAAEGELAWVEGHRGGVRFTRSIRVERWVERVGHKGQQRVDETLAALRGSQPLGDGTPNAAAATVESLSVELDEICDRLASSPMMSVEIAEQLVKLDYVAESLRKLSGRTNQD